MQQIFTSQDKLRNELVANNITLVEWCHDMLRDTCSLDASSFIVIRYMLDVSNTYFILQVIRPYFALSDINRNNRTIILRVIRPYFALSDG